MILIAHRIPRLGFNMAERHDFVSISVVPIDVRANAGEVEYAEAPERSADLSPEQVCQVCWCPLTPKTIQEDCPGPKIPDTVEGLL